MKEFMVCIGLGDSKIKAPSAHEAAREVETKMRAHYGIDKELQFSYSVYSLYDYEGEDPDYLFHGSYKSSEFENV